MWPEMSNAKVEVERRSVNISWHLSSTVDRVSGIRLVGKNGSQEMQDEQGRLCFQQFQCI